MNIYTEQENKKYQAKIDLLLATLPQFETTYVNAVARTKSRRTILSYLQKHAAFFEYMSTNSSVFCSQPITTYVLEDLNRVTLDDANNFLTCIYNRQRDDAGRSNSNNTVEIYISALSSLFGYFYKNEYIKNNPFTAVERKRNKTDKPLYLQNEDNLAFYDNVLTGKGLTEKQKATREKQGTAYRDYIICRTLGSTGIRVSELVGLDYDKIDLERKQFKVIRKGNKPQTIYMSDKLAEEMQEYITDSRPLFIANQNEKGLFLVAQGKYKGTRLSIKTVESIVKKYATAQGLPESWRFTPHKLRHTYAMNVLRKSGNLRLTQQLMGHENVATTTIYSRMLETDLEQAKNLGEYTED